MFALVNIDRLNSVLYIILAATPLEATWGTSWEGGGGVDFNNPNYFILDLKRKKK